MLEKIKNIGEKIPEIIVKLIAFVLVIMVGFGIVVGIFAIIYYLGLWVFIVSILLIDFILIVIDWWYDNFWH